MYQRLLFPLSPKELELHLERALARRVVVDLVPNRSTLLRVVPEEGRVRLRLHSMFLWAPGPVLDALARWAKSPGDALANGALERFMSGEAGRLPARRLRSRGRFHDLAELFARLERDLFEAPVSARVGWGRGSAERCRASILFGSHERGTILVHPALDQEWVPRPFVELVLHHEMLHAVLPSRRHPPEFHRRERRFPGFEEWTRWERANLPRFLGRRGAAKSRR